MAITRTIKFSGPAERLTMEVTFDSGKTWIPYNQIYGGSMSGIDEKNGWSIPHWPRAYDGEWTDDQYNKSQYCQHKWVDTGMRKTFCKECDIDGDYDPMTKQVTVIWKEKKNGQQKETK